MVIGASWFNFEDAVGIQKYELCVGTVPGGSDVLPCADVGRFTRAVAYVTPPPSGW